jgi:hypothetical protein
MLSARSAAAAVCISLAVLLTIPHAAIGQHAPAAGMRSHFGAIGGRAGAFGFQRGFAPQPVRCRLSKEARRRSLRRLRSVPIRRWLLLLRQVPVHRRIPVHPRIPQSPLRLLRLRAKGTPARFLPIVRRLGLGRLRAPLHRSSLPGRYPGLGLRPAGLRCAPGPRPPARGPGHRKHRWRQPHGGTRHGHGRCP